MIYRTYLRLQLGINGNVRELMSLMCAHPHFSIVFTFSVHVLIIRDLLHLRSFTLMLSALIPILLTMM